MLIRNTVLVSATALCMAFSIGGASAQQQVKSPSEVQKALSVMNRVLDHTQRLIQAKNYSQLPRENTEFVEGSQALEKSLTSEPEAFKTKVEGLVKKADDK